MRVLGGLRRVHLLGGGLAVVLVPLVALPILRDREDRPDRPGLKASCPVDPPGSSPAPGPELDPRPRSVTFDQVVPTDGGQPSFQLDPDGEVVVVLPDLRAEGPSTGGTGAPSGDGTGPGTGGEVGTTGTAGVPSTAAPPAGDGGGTTGGADGGAGTDGSSPTGTAPDGVEGGQGQPGEPTATTTPDTLAPTSTAPSTVPPEQVAEEVVEDRPDAGFDLAVLLPLLLVGLLAVAAVLFARRRTDNVVRGDDADPDDESPLERALREAGLDEVEEGPSVDPELRLRLAFVHGLYALDEAELVPFDPSRTSGAVARRLRRPRRRPFLDASGTFDQVVYGGRAARDEDVDRVETGFAEVLSAEEGHQ